ncbi:forkhead box protein P2-like isoform X2 [Littorina saxatilis]|uniref:forkhead box protein P2-like isoform X2 n=1 Tax=Littorina saxatilis TaxID=31220 RepID=UPI0038B41F9A
MMEDSGAQPQSQQDLEGAINLSTVREAASKGDHHLNGDITHNGENGHDAAALPLQLPQRIPGKGTPVPALSGAAKRKNKASPADPTAAAVAAAMQQTQQHQNLMMLAAQQGLTPQQMQELQQQLMGGGPPQSSSLMQQQQQQNMLLQHQKLHEQALHQLNEQLQMNILQQSQLLQTGSSGSDKSKGSKAVQQQLQQLAVQQQQLVQQINQMQIQQRQYLLACVMQPFGVPQGECESVGELEGWGVMMVLVMVMVVVYVVVVVIVVVCECTFVRPVVDQCGSFQCSKTEVYCMFLWMCLCLSLPLSVCVWICMRVNRLCFSLEVFGAVQTCLPLLFWSNLLLFFRMLGRKYSI